MPKNKDSSELADGFHNVGFFENTYVILAFQVTVFRIQLWVEKAM